jgi:transposase
MAYIVRQKNKRGGIDIYYTTSQRISGKTHPVQNRKYLGKLDIESSELLKNRKLSNLTADELEALHRNGIMFKGRETSPPGRKSLSEPKTRFHEVRQWRSLEAGRVLVMKMLAEESGLFGALEKAFGKQEALEIFAVALFECVENAALYRSENWIDDTILAEENLAVSKSSVGRLVEETGTDEAAVSVFFQEWIKALGYPKVLVHDTTSISSYAEKISLIEYGYNRDREKLPQLNFGMVYTAKEQLPLLYRLIPGSIPDVSTLKGTSRLLEEYGLKHFTYALDRGYYSKANILDMLAEKIQFTIGAPLYVSDIKKILNKHRSRLEKIESGLLVGDESYRYGKDILLLKGEKKRGRSHKLGVHIFMNRKRRSQAIHELDTLFLSIQDQFKCEAFKSKADALEWCEEKFPVKSSLYEVQRRKGKFELKVPEDAYAEKIKNLGIFIILNSDPKADALDTLYANRKRDAVEKLFDILKNSTPNRRLHVASDTKAKGKMFIAFIAVILHVLMENKLRKQGLINSVTVNQAFDLLRKIRIGITSGGGKVLQEIPSKTRKLLENMNITLPKM